MIPKRKTSVVDQIINSRSSPSTRENLSSLLVNANNNRFTIGSTGNNFSTSPPQVYTPGGVDQNSPTATPINDLQHGSPNTSGGYLNDDHGSNRLSGTTGSINLVIPESVNPNRATQEIPTEEEGMLIQIIKKSSYMNAIESICRLLETPQDLEKLGDLKSQAEKQLDKLESQMITLSSTQIEEADQSIQLVAQIKGDLKTKLDENEPDTLFSQMKDLGYNNEQLIEHYDIISEVLLAHNNIKKTIEKLDTLSMLKQQIRRIKKKLAYENDQYFLSAHDGRYLVTCILTTYKISLHWKKLRMTRLEN